MMQKVKLDETRGEAASSQDLSREMFFVELDRLRSKFLGDSWLVDGVGCTFFIRFEDFCHQWLAGIEGTNLHSATVRAAFCEYIARSPVDPNMRNVLRNFRRLLCL